MYSYEREPSVCKRPSVPTGFRHKEKSETNPSAAITIYTTDILQPTWSTQGLLTSVKPHMKVTRLN